MARYTVLALLLFTSVAFPQVTFTFTSFDPPGSVATTAYAVNNAGNVVGYYLDAASGLSAGFERTAKGVFSKPIRARGANMYTTGLNDAGVISGYYFNRSFAETTFTIYQGQLTDFDYDGYQTQVNSVNDNGDLTGFYIPSPLFFNGFLYVKATDTTVTFEVTGARSTQGQGVNRNDIVVGVYSDMTAPFSVFQGFLRDANGDITTFMFPGAYQTYALQINDCNVIAGTFLEASGIQHGYYGGLNHFTQLDYPGATSTGISGINNHGELTGSYADAAGNSHGFVAIPSSPSCML